MKRIVIAAVAIVLCSLPTPSRADQVIMKDGAVYKGKIQIDTDKAILIGNPPFDPQSYLLKTEDIEKIIYEEYRQKPPAERKRGVSLEWRVGESFYSSDELSLKPSPVLHWGAGFRVHPLIEVNGEFDWGPALRAKDVFSVSNGTTTRHYEDFAQYGMGFAVRFYPFYQKTWKAEPFLNAGYHWTHLSPKASGDSLSGAGWAIGAGCLYPLTTHLFLETRLGYEQNHLDTIHFLGQESGISPQIDQGAVSLQVGTSWRF